MQGNFRGCGRGETELVEVVQTPGKGWDGSDFREAAGEVRGESGEPRTNRAREWVFWIETGEVPWCVKDTGAADRKTARRGAEPEQWVQELP